MTLVDFGPAARQMAELVRGAPADLDRPTPCYDYRLGDLLDHIAGLAVAFAAAGTKETAGIGDRPPHADVAGLAPDWREHIPRDLDALAAAWRSPEAWTGMTRIAATDMPGEVVGLIALDEVVIHGWDLAKATDQDFAVDEAALAAVHGFVTHLTDPSQAQLRSRVFAPEVPVPPDAPLLDRVLGLAGRNPQWPV
jgi:uncharacterized protein (TIGR03086 family)